MERAFGVRVKDGHFGVRPMSPDKVDPEEMMGKIRLYFKLGRNGKGTKKSYMIAKNICINGPQTLQEMIQKLPKRWFTMNELANLVSKSRFFKERGEAKAIPMSNRSYMAPMWWFSDYFFNEIGGIDAES
tara:strand:- start:4898 stop:5287 length:390 start_codon:yes stop_codon:yes gene_type:complete